MAFNLAYLIHEAAKSFPDKPAVIFDGGSLTFAEVDALSGRLAAGMQVAGFEPGDRIGLQLPNIPQFVIAYFGILKAGCVELDQAELIEFVKQRLAAYKYPRTIEFRSDLKHGPTGKILKTELR